MFSEVCGVLVLEWLRIEQKKLVEQKVYSYSIVRQFG